MIPKSLVRSVLMALGGCLMLLSTQIQAAQSEPSALTCDDFKPTASARERFPDLEGACEDVVERNGELFAKFVAVVRRASNRAVTLYLPATDKTFTVNPSGDAQVLLGGRSAQVRDLRRGQEIRIYLATSQFAKPNIEEIAFVTEERVLITQPVVEPSVAALPTTASLWPTLGLAGAGLFLAGLLLRGLRRASLR